MWMNKLLFCECYQLGLDCYSIEKFVDVFSCSIKGCIVLYCLTKVSGLKNTEDYCTVVCL